ncbi:MAG: hypothetical protein H0S79_24065 [Anaerolineaceae bacterium]|nr:hypothetical protein [Anaerolineaceae bacterium]
MNGFFGTTASYNSDLSLITSIFFFGVGLIAYFQARNRKFGPHANLMVWAVLLNWIPILIVMIPTALKIVQYDLKLTTGVFAMMPIIHAVIGTVAQLVMTYTVIRMKWARKLPPRRTRVLMRVAMVLWVLTILGGIGLYVAAFVI